MRKQIAAAPLIAATAMTMVLTYSVAIYGADGLAYPTDYRSWQHVKSMIIQPGHPLEDPFAGIHHIYANSSAMDGLNGAQYVDGAVFV